MIVYGINGVSVNGGYTDSIREYQAQETAKSLIWIGRRLDKQKGLDVFDTNDSHTVIRVYTTDPSKVTGHLQEIRKRFREHLENVREAAANAQTALAKHEWTVSADQWWDHVTREE